MRSVTKSTRAAARDRGRHQYSCLCPPDRIRIFSVAREPLLAALLKARSSGLFLGRACMSSSPLSLIPGFSGFRLRSKQPFPKSKSGANRLLSNSSANQASIWRTIGEILAQGKIVGPKVHDARIAAICRAHGVRELWSADRDFSRIRGVKVTNPVLHFTK